VKVAIIGVGVIGTSLGLLLQRAGHTLVAITSRTKRHAQAAAQHLGPVEIVSDPGMAVMGADVTLLAVPDREIEAVAAQVAGGGALKRGSVVAHLAGGLPSSILADARAAGAAVGCCHPLQTFADVDTAVRLLPETHFFLEGDPAAVDVLAALATSIGGHPVRMGPDGKALYHAGAVAASNFVVTLVDYAVNLLVAAGVPHDRALPALLPLLEGTLHNLRALGLPKALTGPIARGDAPTVERHVDALGRAPGDLLRLYRELARKNVEVALKKGGLTHAQAERILALLRSEDWLPPEPTSR
jgi:predicted short-subunit dehydrogenase-like oxidoreductase (DUF2520 family)